jgi:hypothetical protein
MTAPHTRYWQETLKNLKVGFNNPASPPEALNQIEVDPRFFFGWETLKTRFNQTVAWFQSMSATGKIFTAIGSAILIFTLLKTVFEILSSLITLCVVAVIFYGVYRIWIAPKPES